MEYWLRTYGEQILDEFQKLIEGFLSANGLYGECSLLSGRRKGQYDPGRYTTVPSRVARSLPTCC